MAVEITVTVLIAKLQDLLAQKEISYPRLRSQATWSIAKLQWLQTLLTEVENKRESSAQKELFVELLRNLYAAEGNIESFFLRSSLRSPSLTVIKMNPFAFFGSAWSQILLSSEMEKLTSNLTKFSSQYSECRPDHPGRNKDARDHQIRPALGDQSHHPRRWKRMASFAEEPDDDVLKDQEQELAEVILGSHSFPFVVSVVGGRGSGKTTLMRRVCNRVDIKRQFENCLAWVHVSNDYEERDLLKGILTQFRVSKKEERLAIELLRERVRKVLVQKKYLIVLDDVQSPDVWEDLRFAFPHSSNGSRIVLTTRDANVAHHFDPWMSFSLQLRRLTDEESWTLFLKKVQRGEDSLISSGLLSLKGEILSKCGGVPLTIVMLGGMFFTKQLNYQVWSRLIGHGSFDEDPSDSMNIVAVGYEDLPSALKPCLLYLGLFPRSYEIPVRRLFRLWLAEGLATPTAGQHISPEDLVETYFEELVNRNMIEVEKWRLDGSPKKCCMPGALYDTLSQDAMAKGFFHVHRNLDYKKEPQFNVQRIAEYLDIKSYPSSDPYIQHLRSYISFNTRKGDTPADEVDKLLNKIVAKRGFGLLTVLDLENIYKPFLSEALGKLLRLKYLGLRWTFLDSVPQSVGKLPCLETLDVKHTNITTLPVSIWHAKKLRHLYMNNIHFDMCAKMSPCIDSLAHLQTLWGLLIGKNNSAINWLQRLISIRKLGLTCHSSTLGTITDWITKLMDLESLRLRSINGFYEPSELNVKTLKGHKKLNDLYLLGRLRRNVNMRELLPANLRVLTLSVSQLEEDPMPILGELPHLHILRLFAHSYLGKGMKCLPATFPELRVLKLWMLEELEEWDMGHKSMPVLQVLEIRRCRKMRPPVGLQQRYLEELTLTNMPEDFVADIKAIVSKDVFVKVHNCE
uniref:Putative disease resistance protein RF9 n=1 Tax=Rhizophora mucronata TaxID=61149 RepID=A0A2P2QMP5_RHIMU